MRKTAQQLIREAREACAAVAVGEFVPVVIESVYTFGGKEWLIGYPSQTANGQSCVIWTTKNAAPAAST